MAPNTTIGFNCNQLLAKKLTRIIFIDWYHNLRIILTQEKKGYILETLYHNEPIENASDADQSAYKKHTNDPMDVICLMLANMSSVF